MPDEYGSLAAASPREDSLPSAQPSARRVFAARRPYYLSGAIACVALCGLGSYGASGRCEPCAAGCTACSSAEQCTACQPGLTLLGGKCITSAQPTITNAESSAAELVGLSSQAKAKVLHPLECLASPPDVRTVLPCVLWAVW